MSSNKFIELEPESITDQEFENDLIQYIQSKRKLSALKTLIAEAEFALSIIEMAENKDTEHRHQCPVCDLVWSHKPLDIEYGKNAEAHSCPRVNCTGERYSLYLGSEDSSIYWCG